MRSLLPADVRRREGAGDCGPDGEPFYLCAYRQLFLQRKAIVTAQPTRGAETTRRDRLN